MPEPDPRDHLPRNLSELLAARGAAYPEVTLGTPGRQVRLAEAVETAVRAGAALLDLGLEPGDRIAVVDHTSTDYLVFWMACQFAGLAPGLVNPSYPGDLLAEMLSRLAPAAVVTATGAESFGADAPAVGLRGLSDGRLAFGGAVHRLRPTTADLPGFDLSPLDRAGFMHTSGTTGVPKFCVQSHRYFLALGRCIAEVMELDPEDRVCAPLPMFHLNPLGYGFLGALTAGADLLCLERFDPGAFWGQVVSESSTVLFLHAPPVRVLLQRTATADAAGHRVRRSFFADADFLDAFEIPTAVSVYGSTEVGGLSHSRLWRRGEPVPEESPAGMGSYAGTARPGVEWRLGRADEIEVRAAEPGILFDGYWVDGAVDDPTDVAGWFATGDTGLRVGDDLVFLRRASESIRVRGEYVPIDFVEQHVAAACPGLSIALWKLDGPDAADELPILYVAGEPIPADAIAAAVGDLPRFMRPTRIVEVAALPFDGAAGKIRRHLLRDAEVLATHEVG